MNTEELNTLKEHAYKIAADHGFHNNTKPDIYWLGLVMSEAGEAINADRKVKYADIKGYESKEFPFSTLFEKYIKDSIEDEVADIVIRLLDFAGMKKYELAITQHEHDIAARYLSTIDKYTLSGFFFDLIGSLSEAFDIGFLAAGVNNTICILADCFKKLTNSDKDLWWFVDKKMSYNKIRPMLNGKKY